MRKPSKITIRILSIAVVGLLILPVALYLASQSVPRFYQQALQSNGTDQQLSGDELELQVLALHNDVQKAGNWETIITQQQINGWLAVDLPEKFPHALPAELNNPRVAIEPSRARIACQYRQGNWTTVVSVVMEISLTEDPNVVAVRICRARAGLLPLPLREWLDQITQAAQRANVPLRWADKNGDPVALINISPGILPQTSERFKLKSVELRDGKVYISGTTREGGGIYQSLSSASIGSSGKKRAVQQ